MEREPKLDRPALTYRSGDKTVAIPQQVGFNDGSPFQMSLEFAIEKGYIKKGEIEIKQFPLEGYWKHES